MTEYFVKILNCIGVILCACGLLCGVIFFPALFLAGTVGVRPGVIPLLFQIVWTAGPIGLFLVFFAYKFNQITKPKRAKTIGAQPKDWINYPPLKTLAEPRYSSDVIDTVVLALFSGIAAYVWWIYPKVMVLATIVAENYANRVGP